VALGTLYVVATPIGNLQDFSPRAQQTLAKVNWIAAEDTRHSRPLLQHFGLNTPLIALHEHNEQAASANLLNRLLAGESGALISDAGTPLISDPGFLFIQTVHAHQIPVVPIPGASAVISALSVAGFPADKFNFEGFLPAKAHARRECLQQLATVTRTLVFYEAPHRIVETLTDMADIFGATRQATLVKELTKVYETVLHAPLPEIISWLTAKTERQKGEFVIVVAAAPPPDIQEISPEAQRILKLLREAMPLKQAAKLTSEITGLSKNSLYSLALAQEKDA
jgi:16S rRNA (cytidine1402-2'-O)-methyltransferase